jgi:peptidoglycan/LPS O-acetylase OafA/YrhL
MSLRPQQRDTSRQYLTQSLSYRPDIDGLRAIAVIMVVGFHAFPSVFSGGFGGVDVFFVISGYLISAILLRSFRENTYSLVTFYQNRVRRLFPALITVLIFCVVSGWYLFTADEFKQLGKHLAAASLFVSNIVYINERGYFDMASETKPLLHLWSLAVEEQFYIFLPLLLLTLERIKSQALKVLALLITASFLFCLLFQPDATTRFYSPLTRGWELLTGTLVALLEDQRRNLVDSNDRYIRGPINVFNRWPNLFSALGVLSIASSTLLVSRQNDWPGIGTMLPVLGTALLIIIGLRSWINRAILSCKTLVGIGLISYPIYLWHWPLLVIATMIEGTRPSILQRVIALSIALGLSIATYFFIERPLRYGDRKHLTIAILILLMSCLGIFGYAAYQNGGYAQRAFAWQFKNVSAAVEDWDGATGFVDVTYLGQPAVGNLTQPPEILFIGDSHLEQFMPRVAKLTQQNQFPPSIFLLGGGCPPIPSVFEDSLKWCQTTFGRIVAVTEKVGTIKKIVVGGCWNCYFLAETQAADSAGKSLSYYYQTPGGRREYFREGLGAPLAIEQLEKFLRSLAKDYQVYLLLDNPMGAEFSPKSLIGNRLSFHAPDRLTERVQIHHDQLELNEQLKEVAKSAGVEVIDQLAYLCPEGKCLRLTNEKQPIYRDDHHLRPFFVKDHADYFERQLFR